jgi:hypothetical protein
MLVHDVGDMPAYYVALTGWTSLGDSRAWIRALSLLSLALAVWVLGLLVSRIDDSMTALVVCLVTSGSVLLVRYGQEARGYTLLVLLTTLSWLALVRLLEAPSARSRQLLYAIAGLLPLVHGLAMIVLVTQAACLAVARVSARVWRSAAVAFVLGAVLVTGAIALGADERGSSSPPLSPGVLKSVVAAQTSPYLVLSGMFALAVAWGAWLSVCKLRRATSPTERFGAAVPVVWALGYLLVLLLISVPRPTFSARYSVPAAVPISWLAGLALVDLVRRIRPWLRLTGALIAVGAVAIAVLLPGQVQVHRDRGYRWDLAAKEVATDARKGDAIVVPAGELRLPFDYAWLSVSHSTQPPAAISPSQPLGTIRWLDVVPLAVDATVRRAQRYERLWVVHGAHSGVERPTDEFLDHPVIHKQFVTARSWTFDGGIELLLLRRR